MPTKTRIITVIILILLGGALFYYCAALYPVQITTQVKGGSTTVTVSGTEPVKENSTGCAERDKSDQVNHTSSKDKPSPKAGAT